MSELQASTNRFLSDFVNGLRTATRYIRGNEHNMLWFWGWLAERGVLGRGAPERRGLRGGPSYRVRSCAGSVRRGLRSPELCGRRGVGRRGAWCRRRRGGGRPRRPEGPTPGRGG